MNAPALQLRDQLAGILLAVDLRDGQVESSAQIAVTMPATQFTPESVPLVPQELTIRSYGQLHLVAGGEVFAREAAASGNIGRGNAPRAAATTALHPGNYFSRPNGPLDATLAVGAASA